MLKIDFWNIAFILINLLVWYWFVRRFLFGPIAKIIEERQKVVENDLDSAKQSRTDAEALKQRYEASIADAKQEAAAIIDDAHARADVKYSELMQQAKSDADRVLADTRKTIALEQEKSMHELEGQISVLAMAAAEKVLAEKSSEARDRAAYDSFLGAVKESGEQSGKNG